MSRSPRHQRVQSAKHRGPFGASTRGCNGGCEALEPRQLLAVLTWTGAGDGRLWTDAANWDGGVVPAHGDEVTIPDVTKTSEVVFPTNTAPLRLEKLVVDEWFRLQGGVDLSGGGPYQFSSLNVELGARLDGTAKVQVGGGRGSSGFQWTGGTIAGTGVLNVDLDTAAAPGSIQGGTLARTLSISGAVDLTDTLFFGENGRRSTGVLEVERGGLLNWTGGNGLQRNPLSGSADHRLDVAVGGTFRKLTQSRLGALRGVDLVNAGTVDLNVGAWTLDGDFTQTVSGQILVTVEGPILQDGSHHSQVQVSGIATLAGSILVRTTNSSSLVTGEAISFMTMVGNASEKRGVFDAWWGRRLEDGRWLRPLATVAGVMARVEDLARSVDAYEPNEGPKQAFNLKENDFHQAALSLDRLTDEDWFQWTAPARGTLSVAIEASQAKSDLDVSVLDADGHEVRESSTIGGREKVTLPVLAGETYWIRIHHHDERSAVTDYALAVEWHPAQPRVYVAADGEIHVFTEDGDALPAETIRHPLLKEGRLTDVELDAQGTIYVGLDLGLPGGADGRIVSFSPRGELIRAIPLPADTTNRRQAYPAGFDLLADGSLLVAQPNSGRIVHVDGEGKTLGVALDVPQEVPIDVAVLSNGELRWANRRDPTLPSAMNVTDLDLVWRADEATAEAVLLRGSTAVRRVSSLFPIVEAQSSSDRNLYLLGRSASGDGGSLERYDSSGRRMSVTRLNGSIGGMAVSRGERPGNTNRGITDRDADGLPDLWEEQGVDINSDGVIDLDLPAMGANPDRKDLFIEVDAMLGRTPALLGTSPTDVTARGLATGTILDEVVEAFLHAPVNNPDGSTGIDLHLVIDETTLPMSANGWKGWDEFDQFKSQYFGTVADRSSPNASARRLARTEVFRYAVFADRQAGSTSSGMAELPGNDFAVTLGAWPVPGGTGRQQAGTFMHELGHTLGLREGGGDDIEYKPNYISVMNYHWQVPNGNVGWRLDYSHEELPTLDENDLDEKRGIGLSRRDADLPRRLGIQVGPPAPQHVSLIGAINWSRDDFDGDGFVANDRHVAADLNRVFEDQNGDGLVNDADASPGELLRGHNDWANLRFTFRDLHDTSSGRSLHFDGDDSTELVSEDTERLNDDIFGGNDSPEDAADLGNGDWEDLDLTLPVDILNDWFFWTAGLAGKVLVTLSVVDSTLPIDLVVRDASQVELARKSANHSSVSIELPVNAGQKLYLQVTRLIADLTAHYTLSIDGPDFGDGPVFWSGQGNGVQWNDPDNWLVQGVSPGLPSEELPGDDLIWGESVDEALVELAGEPLVHSLLFLSDATLSGAALSVEGGKVEVGANCQVVLEADVWGNELTKLGEGTLQVVGNTGAWIVTDGQLEGSGTVEQVHVETLGTLATASGPDQWIVGSDLIVDGQLLGIISDHWGPLQVYGAVELGAQSRLLLEARTPLSTLGTSRRVLVQSADGFNGSWQESPPANSSLGYGVFLKQVGVEPFDSQFSLVADLFQAFAGDANGDEHFDSADLVTIFQAGRFEQAGGDPVDWSQGDWDGDGQFTSSDLVVAFQEGRYES